MGLLYCYLAFFQHKLYINIQIILCVTEINKQMPIKTMGLSVVAQRLNQRCYCACAVFGNL